MHHMLTYMGTISSLVKTSLFPSGEYLTLFITPIPEVILCAFPPSIETSHMSLFETREHRDDHIETHRKGVGKKAYNKKKMEETKLKNRAETKENKIETP